MYLSCSPLPLYFLATAEKFSHYVGAPCVAGILLSVPNTWLSLILTTTSCWRYCSDFTDKGSDFHSCRVAEPGFPAWAAWPERSPWPFLLSNGCAVLLFPSTGVWTQGGLRWPPRCRISLVCGSRAGLSALRSPGWGCQHSSPFSSSLLYQPPAVSHLEHHVCPSSDHT